MRSFICGGSNHLSAPASWCVQRFTAAGFVGFPVGSFGLSLTRLMVGRACIGNARHMRVAMPFRRCTNWPLTPVGIAPVGYMPARKCTFLMTGVSGLHTFRPHA
ncbi:hypothetical protein GCM10009540_78040 [Streptomyces turgidiscabies]